MTSPATKPAILSKVVAFRDRIRRLPGGRLAWRSLVTVVGLVVIVVGIVLLPLPGPGWLIIFLGLGLWASEYAWAARLTTWVRRQVMRWWDWVNRRRRWEQVAIGALLLAFTVCVSVGAWYLL